MRFLSICSGIEAASVAFHPLGWQALAFAEIEPFPCSLLAHHYPQVPNLGDLTRWREWSPQLLAQADVLCGGTPCQAFSVAGLRGSLSDERGNLTLTFCHLFDEIDRQRHLHGRPPAVCLWENVPGVLNTPDNAFGHFLAGLAGEDVPLTPPGSRWTDAGYVRGPRRAVAWRVLDAQYFGLAQRRERVFVVASADPAVDPAAVLFELDGLRRDTPPRRGPGEGTAPTLSARTKGGGGLGTDAECDGAVVPEPMTNAECRMTNENQKWCQDVAPTLNAHFGKKWGLEDQHINGGAGLFTAEMCAPLTGNAYADNASEESKLVPERRDLEPGRLGDEEMLPFTFKASHFTRGKDGAPSDLAPPLSADADKGDQDTLVAYPQQDKETRGQGDGESFAFDLRGREGGAMPEGPHATANLRAGSGGSSRSYVAQKAEPGVLPFDTTQITSKTNRSQPRPGDPCHPLAAGAHAPSIAFQPGNLARGAGSAPSMDVFPTLKSDHGRGKSDQDPHVACQEPSAAKQWRVRRLTPEECELLQGFPIGYTLIPGTSSKKRKGDDLRDTIDYLISLGVSPAEAEVLAHSPDGPRYKALGNSWAVPVARWIARRIDACTKALSRQ